MMGTSSALALVSNTTTVHMDESRSIVRTRAMLRDRMQGHLDLQTQNSQQTQPELTLDRMDDIDMCG